MDNRQYWNQERYGEQRHLQTGGLHRGKGPRGYRRSDERIREDVNDRLYEDPYVDASNIDVKVEEGNVILSGRVDDREAKRHAVDIAESVTGVTNVENRLRVGQGIVESFANSVAAGLEDVTVGHELERANVSGNNNTAAENRRD